MKNRFILPKKIRKEYNQIRFEINRNQPVCLAPLKSLRFLPDGNITVCCHNNSWVLGKYPEVSVLDAWNSVNMNSIRKKILKSDFSFGCYECLPDFLNRNFNSVNPILYENHNSNANFPVILDFKIATECNLECVMCSEYSSSSIRTARSGKTDDNIFDEGFLRQIEELVPHLKEARFSGGEPFLNKIYYDIWDMLVRLNPDCKISIQTNGTILNDKIKKLLESGEFHINISVDSANPDKYAQIRRNGNFEKLYENIKYFSSYSKNKNILLGITACCMKDNVFDLLGVMELANEFNAKIWYSDVHFPLVNALWVLSSMELKAIVKELESFKSEHSDSYVMNKHNSIVYLDMIDRIRNLAIAAEKRETNSNFVSLKKLISDLRKVFKANISKNPDIWTKIENSLKILRENEFINLAEEIKKYYKSDFVYDQLGLMSEEILKQNFASLMKK